MLTAEQLAHLGADLIERGTVYIDRKHLRQVRAWLSQKRLSVTVSLSAPGYCVELRTERLTPEVQPA